MDWGAVLVGALVLAVVAGIFGFLWLLGWVTQAWSK